MEIFYCQNPGARRDHRHVVPCGASCELQVWLTLNCLCCLPAQNGAGQHAPNRNLFGGGCAPAKSQAPSLDAQEKIANQIRLAFVIYLGLLQSWK